MQSTSPGQVRLQVHTEGIASLAVAALKTECEALAGTLPGALGVRFEEGEDDGAYLNIVFGSHAPGDLWPHIKAALYQSPVFGATLLTKSMALRTGCDGWNDYVLLHHFDPSIPTERTQ